MMSEEAQLTLRGCKHILSAPAPALERRRCSTPDETANCSSNGRLSGVYFCLSLETHPCASKPYRSPRGLSNRTRHPLSRRAAVPDHLVRLDSAQHGADLFDLKVAGNIYTRIMNPTTDVLEKRVGRYGRRHRRAGHGLGHGGTPRGDPDHAEAGDNIVGASTLYGGTYNLFAHTFRSKAFEVRFADPRDPASFAN